MLTTVTSSRDDTSRSVLTTPSALAAARTHINCDLLTGVELEDDGGSGTAGSHLEAYLFFGDVMCGWIYSTDTIYAPTPFGQAIVSNVTLGVMEDLGYYTVNWDHAGALVWASGGGCDFAALPCEAYLAAESSQSFFAGSAGAGTQCMSDRRTMYEATSEGLGCFSRHRPLYEANTCALGSETTIEGVHQRVLASTCSRLAPCWESTASQCWLSATS